MIESLETSDFDQFTDAQRGWETSYRPVRAERFSARMVSTYNESAQVDLERWNSPLEITGAAPEGSLSVVVPLHDSNNYVSSGLLVTPSHIDIFGPGCEVCAVMKQQTALIALSFPTQAIDRRIDSPGATLLAEEAIGHNVIRSTPQATDALRRYVTGLQQRLAQDSWHTDEADQLLDEFLLAIARALPPLREEQNVSFQHRFLLARRARDLMMEQQTDALTISRLCAILYCSERTLHRAFSEVYDVSPKRFLKARRMFSVYQKLKSAAPGERIADIATRHGFRDLGYFARDYRAMFGELPSITLRKTRG